MDWQQAKKEIRKLAIAIRGSTKEEFSANLANLEDFIYKTYYKKSNKKISTGRKKHKVKPYECPYGINGGCSLPSWEHCDGC